MSLDRATEPSEGSGRRLRARRATSAARTARCSTRRTPPSDQAHDLDDDVTVVHELVRLVRGDEDHVTTGGNPWARSARRAFARSERERTPSPGNGRLAVTSERQRTGHNGRLSSAAPTCTCSSMRRYGAVYGAFRSRISGGNDTVSPDPVR